LREKMTNHSAALKIADYQDVYGSFAAAVDEKIMASPAMQCCDRHDSNSLALRWLGPDGSLADLTYEDLRAESARFASLLGELGVRPGDVVAVMLPRVPELAIALLGTMRIGAVYLPLFTAFGSKAAEDRVRASGAKLIVTDKANRSKLNGLDDVQVILLSDRKDHEDLDFRSEISRQSSEFECHVAAPDAPLLLLYTSGTTGKPKGVQVPILALQAFEVYMRYGIGLQRDDVYWNIADPGWAYGLYYGVIGPLLLGNAVTFYSGPFTPESTVDVIRRFDVTNLAGSPTAFRLLMARGDSCASRMRGRLRVVSSAGEALNAEVIRWFADELECPVHDHYGQTESGMVLANHHGLRHPVQPGTAGRSLPGVRAVVLDEQGHELPANSIGELAVDRASSPLFWFEGYWAGRGQAIPTPHRYHRTGDLAKMDSQGTVTFVGRADDIITTSGYRIGPFDVESTLMEHPAVAEVAVVGKPDATRTEIVKAFVVLREGELASQALGEELGLFVKNRLAAHAYPREVDFVAELPKTPSGKIQRFVLRQRG
jgi:acetyl-CoA synthetase